MTQWTILLNALSKQPQLSVYLWDDLARQAQELRERLDVIKPSDETKIQGQLLLSDLLILQYAAKNDPSQFRHANHLVTNSIGVLLRHQIDPSPFVVYPSFDSIPNGVLKQKMTARLRVIQRWWNKQCQLQHGCAYASKSECKGSHAMCGMLKIPSRGEPSAEILERVQP